MIARFNAAIYARPGRDQQIEKQSIAAAGNKLGRPGPNNASNPADARIKKLEHMADVRGTMLRFGVSVRTLGEGVRS
jgi:hypothetical protein